MLVVQFLSLLTRISALSIGLSGDDPQVIHRLFGNSAGDLFGSAVAITQDLNRDGHADLIVGAPGDAVKGPGSGSALVYSGQSGRVLHTVHGVNVQDKLGTAVTGLGDVDGDQVPDFAVGLPGAKPKGMNSGAVWICSGKTGEVLRRFSGHHAWMELGCALADAGDVNSDGAGDILVGARGSDRKGARAGSVYLFSGATGQVLLQVHGEQPNEQLGSTLAAAGDLDRDGISDFISGSPAANANGLRSGLARVYSGKEGKILHEFKGQARQEEFGIAVSGAGDVNADGVPDVIIGAHQSSSAKPNGGSAFVYSGANGSLLFALHGESERSNLGRAVGAAGDWNGDGRDDVLVGVPGESSRKKSAGCVKILSGIDGALLDIVHGRAAEDRFGESLFGGLDINGDGRADWIAGAAYHDRGGKNCGAAHAMGFDPQENVAKAPPPAGDNISAGASAKSTLPALFDPIAAERGWHRESSSDGRWILYGSVTPALIREAALLIDHTYQRLDELFGTTAVDREAQIPGPVYLFLVKKREDVQVSMAAIGETFPHLKDWAKQVGQFPRVLHWNPLLAVVRHDASTKLVKRPEVQLAHMAMQMELSRRYGRIPYWLAEAMGYGLQDEMIGGIYGYSNRKWEKLDDLYHQGWRAGAFDALHDSPPDTSELFMNAEDTFEQRRAYLQFALSHWLLWKDTGKAAQLMEVFAKARKPDWPIDVAWEPEPALQSRLLADTLGQKFFEEVRGHWTGVSTEGGPGSIERGILSAVANVLEKYEIRKYNSKDERIHIYSDFDNKFTNQAVLRSFQILKRIDKALGKPKGKQKTSLYGFLIKEKSTFEAVCDAIGENDPVQAEFMTRSKLSTGFTIYRPPLTAYFHDTRIQEEARPDHSIAHNFVHLEIFHRYGPMPLWLAEGLACAGEEGAFGEVWANWNRDEFVYAVSHGAWRKTAKKLITDSKTDISKLYSYSARPYQDDLAHLAFGFATYGLDGNPKGFAKFLSLLRKEYQKNWTGVGRFEPSEDLMQDLVQEAFGSNFEKSFRTWWQKKG